MSVPFPSFSISAGRQFCTARTTRAPPAHVKQQPAIVRAVAAVTHDSYVSFARVWRSSESAGSSDGAHALRVRIHERAVEHEFAEFVAHGAHERPAERLAHVNVHELHPRRVRRAPPRAPSPSTARTPRRPGARRVGNTHPRDTRPSRRRRRRGYPRGYSRRVPPPPRGACASRSGSRPSCSLRRRRAKTHPPTRLGERRSQPCGIDRTRRTPSTVLSSRRHRRDRRRIWIRS